MDDQEEIAIQFGIQLDEDGSPVVVMIFPDIEYGEDEEPMAVLIGDAGSVSVFATQLLRVGQIASDLTEEVAGVDDHERVMDILNDYGKRLNSPYN